MELLEAIVDRLFKIQRETEAAKWLNELETFKCPTCGKDTIFKTGCNECEEENEI